MGVIYLDVDGVCNYLHKDSNGFFMELVLEMKQKLEAFFQAGHRIKWLTCHTTHDVEIDNVYYVGFCSVGQLQELMGLKYHDSRFKYINWQKLSGGLKTSGIDFCENFVWLEDGILPQEKEVLKECKCLDRYFEVDERKGLTWDIVKAALKRLEGKAQ